MMGRRTRALTRLTDTFAKKTSIAVDPRCFKIISPGASQLRPCKSPEIHRHGVKMTAPKEGNLSMKARRPQGTRYPAGLGVSSSADLLKPSPQQQLSLSCYTRLDAMPERLPQNKPQVFQRGPNHEAENACNCKEKHNPCKTSYHPVHVVVLLCEQG